MFELLKPERIWLSKTPELNEKWVQSQIAKDPSLLGLGDLIVKDVERLQPKAGRLDLLLQDPDTLRRYEVELQLGTCDESHIIRTVEYWDIERRRYPTYDHCAVIVAEEITGRFLNVVSLFNGHIPLIAIQMSALKIDSRIALVFTRVLDEVLLGVEDEDDDAPATDRTYWETIKGTKGTMAIVDALHKMVVSVAPGMELKYNKHYIGLAKAGQADNFVSFVAKSKTVILRLKLAQSAEIGSLLDDAGIDVLTYRKQYGQYRVRITQQDINTNPQLFEELIKLAWERTRS